MAYNYTRIRAVVQAKQKREKKKIILFVVLGGKAGVPLRKTSFKSAWIFVIAYCLALFTLNAVFRSVRDYFNQHEWKA